MRVGVVTIAAHRTDHLRMQMTALARGSRLPDRHVVVSMGDPEVVSLALGAGADTRWIEPAGKSLPLAEARNLGAGRAIELGADLLIFLDVDCIPAPNLVGRYEEVAGDPHHREALLCGPVTYLPPPPDGGYDVTALERMIDPHPARPHPGPEEVLIGDDHTLFWSLSFAVTAPTWHSWADSVPTTRDTAARTPTSRNSRRNRASDFAGWAGHTRSISITRCRILRSSDCTTS